MTDAPKKILYIEDDPEARFLMADVIRYRGFMYLEASRGLEGIQMAREHLPDLILIDLSLPDMQGYEVTTHLKSFPELKETPIIALTGATHDDVREMVLTAGCDGYISKPVKLDEFLQILEDFLTGKREFVQPEDEKFFLHKYNIQLVARLKKKIYELEQLNNSLNTLNSELYNSREELARYNDRLFYLNNLANYLRTLRDPQDLVRIFPNRMVQGFQIDRCILLETSQKNKKVKLKPASFAGIEAEELSQMDLHLSDQLFEHLKRKGGMIWINDLAQVRDNSLLRFCHKLESTSFILGDLANLGTKDESTDRFRRLTSPPEKTAPRIKSPRLIFFMDKRNSGNAHFATNEIRILKSFLQTAGIIFENMVLYNRLLKLYAIKTEEAIRDGLTGLYNYRYFAQELEREANRTRRFRTPFSLLMIDVDHFKDFNDSYGHVFGDKVLISISRLINRNTRTTDTVARYGGEEFAVILPGLVKKDAIHIAKKLQNLIAGFRFANDTDLRKCRLTISLGVASFPEDSNEPQRLLNLADEALYRAKEGGRNMVCPA